MISRFALFLSLCLLAQPAFAAFIDVEVSPKIVKQGALFLVTVSGPRAPRKANGSFEDCPLRFGPSQIQGSLQAIGGVDISCKPGRHDVVVGGIDAFGTPFTQSITIEVRNGGFRSERLQVAAAMASPDKTQVERIRAEKKLVTRLTSPITPWQMDRCFVRPVKGAVSSAFGTARIFNDTLRSRHYGSDLRGRSGTPVKAANRGTVVMVRNLYFTGNTIFIDHGQGLYSLYAHLGSTEVKEGQQVQCGQLIGRVGSTGRVTGPHLHWGIKLAGKYYNPMTSLQLPIVPEPDSVLALAPGQGEKGA